MFIFGLGYTASRIALALRKRGWRVDATGSAGNVPFEKAGPLLKGVTHILSSIPPDIEGDPVLRRYRVKAPWIGYLSSTGVYGDTHGAWVDESAPLRGRRGGRIEADRAWQALGARVFRLPGIYGPGRSALDSVHEGKAHRVDVPGQVFSRIHVNDIASGVLAGLDAPPGAYNLADDLPCGQNEVVERACALLGLALPPQVGIETLSPMARAFYTENRRVSNGRARRVLDWAPVYPDFRVGLGALSAMTSPASATIPPAAANTDQ